MEILESLKVLKQYCARTSIEDCNAKRCDISKAIGDCVFNEVPEEWELKEIE